jgi:hypothetical protein
MAHYLKQRPFCCGWSIATVDWGLMRNRPSAVIF